MPKGGCSKLRIQLAKLSRRLGRLKELVQRFKKQKLDSETYNLEKKLYGARKVTLAEAEGDMKMASKELNCLLESDRREKLSQWKQTMKTSRPSRADWINRKGGALSPTVVKEDKVAMDKMEAVGMIHDYWIDLWRNQDCWNEDVLQQRTEEITNTLQEDFDRVDLGGCDVRRPGLSLFTKRLLAINGCPGPDGWGRRNEDSCILQHYGGIGLEMHAVLGTYCMCAKSSSELQAVLYSKEGSTATEALPI